MEKIVKTTYNEHIGSAEDDSLTDLRNLQLLFQSTTIPLIIQAMPACLHSLDRTVNELMPTYYMSEKQTQ